MIKVGRETFKIVFGLEFYGSGEPRKMHPTCYCLMSTASWLPLCGHQGLTEHAPRGKVLPIWVALSQPAAKFQASKDEKKEHLKGEVGKKRDETGKGRKVGCHLSLPHPDLNAPAMPISKSSPSTRRQLQEGPGHLGHAPIISYTENMYKSAPALKTGKLIMGQLYHKCQMPPITH